MSRNNMSDHHKDQLLDALMHYLPLDMRAKVMNEVPAAYNAYCEQSSGTAPCMVVRRSDVVGMICVSERGEALTSDHVARLLSLSEKAH